MIQINQLPGKQSIILSLKHHDGENGEGSEGNTSGCGDNKGNGSEEQMMPIKWRVMPMKMFQLAEMLATRRMVMWLVLMMARIHSYVHVVIIFISITFQ